METKTTPEPEKLPVEKPLEKTVTTVQQTVTPVSPVQQTPVVEKKGENGLKITCIVLIVLLVLCLLCGGGIYLGSRYVADNADKIGKDLSDKVSDEIGKEINDSISDSINSAGGDLFDTGTTVELPAGFPTDIPLMSGYRLSAATKSSESGGDTYFAMYSVQNTADQVKAYYTSALPQNGWDYETSSFLFITSYTADKGNKELTVAITGGTDSTSSTLVTLSYSTK